MISHYIAAFTQSKGFLGSKYYQERAVCGAWVNPRTEFSVEPTCPSCKAKLDEQEREAARLLAKWDNEEQKQADKSAREQKA